MRKEHKIHEMMERTIAATFDRGGPHYRELRELFHVIVMFDNYPSFVHCPRNAMIFGWRRNVESRLLSHLCLLWLLQ